MKITQLKRGQKYIVVCTRSISRNTVGLGSSGTFTKDSFVTKSGTPTSDPNDRRKPAQVYVRGVEDFPFDFDFVMKSENTNKTLADFFSPVPVEVTISIL
jgi:hypothetical protein